MNRYSHNSIRLTSVELGFLWSTYMLESLVHHAHKYFVSHIEDENLKSLSQYILDSTGCSLAYLTDLFGQESIPLPRGITAEDIKPAAPRLFSDKFYMIYEVHMSRFALQNYSLAYTQSTCNDIKAFFEHYLNRLVLVNQQCTELALAKGVYSRPPAISIPPQVDFVKNMSFFSGFVGKRRPLTVLEITHLFNNAETNGIGKAFITGLAQVAKSGEIRNYCLRGKAIAEKFIGLFNNVLAREDVSRPPSYDSEVVSNTTESPFSDRMMLFHINLLNAGGFGNYGTAIAASPRTDLTLLYTRILLQVGIYSRAGSNLMVKNGWLEQPPTMQKLTRQEIDAGHKKLLSQPAMKPLPEKRKDEQDKT
ncbi:DUF3231 family protein [Sporomusa aerivorans]|uniref:DUF3231 family protein n=1 Tax=Sporomusa aerivorans TaxID=204936 RepID=UPI00352A5851